MLATQKQLKELMKSLNLDILEGYLDDSYAIRKFILGCEIEINKLQMANEDTYDPLDYMINNNLIKEFENQIELYEEMKINLRKKLMEIISYLENIDDNSLKQLNAIADDEYYVIQTNEIANKEDYIVDYNKLQKENAKIKEKMLGKDYKNIKRSR